MAGIAGSSVFQLGAVLYLKDKAQGAVAGAMKNFGALRKELESNDAAIKKLDRSAGAMKIGGALVAGAATAAVSLLALRYQSSELEANLRSLDIPSDQVDALSRSAGKAAVEFGISKETYLAGAYDIKSAVASLDASGVEAFSTAVAATARATKGDFAQLSKTFGMVYNQFGEASGLDPAAFAMRTADVFSAAVKEYRTDGASLEQAFNSAGASASKLGISLGEQTAVLGTLMNTMNPGEAGTAWKAFTGKIDTGFNSLGVNYKGIDGKLLSTSELLTNLKTKFGDALDPAELSQLNSAFGEEGARVVLNLIGQTDKLGAAIDKMKNVDGTAQAMAATNLESVAGAWDRMQHGMRAFFDGVAKGSDGPLMAMIGGVNYLLSKFQALSPETQSMIGSVVK